MAGAMRRMGVYLGLVEDDDARGGYDRYAARQSDYDHDHDDHGHDREYDRGYDRYASADGADPGDVRYGGYGYGAGYDGDYPDDQRAGRLSDDAVEADVPRRAPEPDVSLGRRPATPRTLGLAGAGTGSTASRLGGTGATPAGASPIGAAASARSRVWAGGVSGGGLAGGGVSGGGVSGAAGLVMGEPVAAAPVQAPT